MKPAQILCIALAVLALVFILYPKLWPCKAPPSGKPAKRKALQMDAIWWNMKDKDPLALVLLTKTPVPAGIVGKKVGVKVVSTSAGSPWDQKFLVSFGKFIGRVIAVDATGKQLTISPDDVPDFMKANVWFGVSAVGTMVVA